MRRFMRLLLLNINYLQYHFSSKPCRKKSWILNPLPLGGNLHHKYIQLGVIKTHCTFAHRWEAWQILVPQNTKIIAHTILAWENTLSKFIWQLVFNNVKSDFNVTFCLPSQMVFNIKNITFVPSVPMPKVPMGRGWEKHKFDKLSTEVCKRLTISHRLTNSIR